MRPKIVLSFFFFLVLVEQSLSILYHYRYVYENAYIVLYMYTPSDSAAQFKESSCVSLPWLQPYTSVQHLDRKAAYSGQGHVCVCHNLRAFAPLTHYLTPQRACRRSMPTKHSFLPRQPVTGSFLRSHRRDAPVMHQMHAYICIYNQLP